MVTIVAVDVAPRSGIDVVFRQFMTQATNLDHVLQWPLEKRRLALQ